MIYPTCDKINDYAADYDIIPVCKEIYADVITPITLLRKIAQKFDNYYLLESIVGGEKWGRYSFLGFNYKLRITCKDSLVKVTGEKNFEKKSDKPLSVIRDILKDYKAPKIKGMPNFAGGLVGYFGYESFSYAEPKLKLKKSDFNDFDLMLFDKVIAYDHIKQKIIVICNMKTDNVMQNYGLAVSEIEQTIALIKENIPFVDTKIKSKPQFSCNVTEKEYFDIVEKTKKHILDGDIFQAVLSRRFETEYYDSLINAYRVLRTTNPSPYMVFIKNEDVEIMSASPETLIKLNNGKLLTFPIAGSRPRGKTDLEDQMLEKELITDEKELSEHNMLVDLGRNDIGKISKINTVNVTEYMRVHRYSQIMHITSEVEGDIKDGLDCLDAIEAVIPAGTLSGAPKIRACEIIDYLEPCARGIYGGALGYIDFTGNMDLCIAIRMAVKKDNKVYIQAGGGIVADSIAKNEYEESGNKAKAVINAVMKAGEIQ